MKKILLLTACGLTLLSCSKEQLDSSYENEVNLSYTSDLRTAVPNPTFDTDQRGLYHGIIATAGNNFHGKLWISIENNGRNSATVETTMGEVVLFSGSQQTDSGTIHFESKRGSFDAIMTNRSAMTFENVTIDSAIGNAVVIKERSNQRVNAMLGSYVDENDASFTGSWDLISDGTPHPSGSGLAVSQIVVMGPNGVLFTDSILEPFSYPCFTGIPSNMPPLLWNVTGVENEIWAFGQSTVWGTDTAYYDLGISARQRDANGFTDNNIGFFNRDLETNASGCNAYVANGYWSWNNRTGTVSFPMDVPAGAHSTFGASESALQPVVLQEHTNIQNR